MSAAKNILVDATVAAVLPELDGFFCTERKTTALRAFLSGEDVCAILLTGTGQSLVIN